MSYVDKGIQRAVEMASYSDCPNYKLGAVLMKGNKLISQGYNIFKKSHTQSKTIYNGIHAEFSCLYNVDYEKARNAALFVARVTNAGVLSMARPCDVCLELLRERGVRVFYYTDYEGNVKREVA